MSQHLRVKLPGTLYFIDLTLDPTTNTGKVLLERKAVEAQKTLSDLDPKRIQSVLLDLLDDQGLNPNPRIISRVLEDLEPQDLEMAAAALPVSSVSSVPPVEESLPETPVDVVTHEVSAPVEIMTNNPLLKVKDIIAAVHSHMSKLDTLIGSPDMTDEVGSTMQAIQDLLMQAKSTINDVLSS